MEMTEPKTDHDPDAAAKVLCAHVGDWRWEQITDEAKDRYRSLAREVVEAHEDGTTEMHMPMFYSLGIGIDYGGAGSPQTR